MEQDMTQGKPLAIILKFTLPLLVGNIFQQFYNMADTIIVDRFVGEITVLVNTIAQFPKYRDAKDVRGSARVTPRRRSTPR